MKLPSGHCVKHGSHTTLSTFELPSQLPTMYWSWSQLSLHGMHSVLSVVPVPSHSPSKTSGTTARSVRRHMARAQ